MTTLTKEQVEKAIDELGCDGHTIWKKEKFDFLPEEFVNKYVVEYESDMSDPKAMIFDKDNNVLKVVKGVYGLTLLWAIAKDIGADTTEAAEKMGRGFQASSLYHAIANKLDQI